MQLTVFGGTGRTGRRVVERACADGHAVTVLARDPQNAALPGAVRVVRGSATDAAAVADALADAEAVVIALSPGGTAGGVEAMVRTIVAEARPASVERVVQTSAYGMVAERPRVIAPVVRRILRATFADQLAADQALQASDLDWTIVRATRLTNRPANGAARRTTALLDRGPFSIGRDAYAAALLDIAAGNGFCREIVNVSG